MPFRRLLVPFGLALLLAAGLVWTVRGRTPAQGLVPVVSAPVKPVDTRGLPPAPPPGPGRGPLPAVHPLRHRPRPVRSAASASPAPPASPSSRFPNAMPALLQNFEGIASTGQVYPPDTDGQVGASHYVQIVNAAAGGAWVRVWDKDTGAQLYDFGLGNLWPTGDPCREYAYGDPVVLYDALANRWLLTQFVWPPSPPYYECIAVSKTLTPTNVPADWYLYSVAVHDSKFNDYPKFGVWPDAYYMSANQFTISQNGESWAGAGVWAFDRAALLSGQPVRFVYFDLSTLNANYGGLLPANLLGDRLPPTGAPGYFMAVDQDWVGTDDMLHLFEFHVDWNTPASSTFRWVKDLVVAPFDWWLGPNVTNIPQPNGAPLLDELTDRLMMHLWYRNFGDHESFVLNHTVDAAAAPNTTLGQAGIRWYEVRGGAVDTTIADAFIYQQGTFAPNDGLHRWMGSIAMDHVGNIALGYSVSSSTVYPGIRVTGRLVTDPAGVMAQGESVVVQGSGVQTGADGRWGDYSAMSVDPTDDCTFWYTQEYVKTSGDRSWNTRVVAFRFPNCRREPGFSLQVLPQEQAICTAQPATYTLALMPISGFSQTVTLTATAWPSGTSVTVTPTQVLPPANSRLTLTGTQALPYGRYPLTVTAQSGAQRQSATAWLTVFDQSPLPPTLTLPADRDMNQGLYPVFAWQPITQAHYTLQIAPTAQFSPALVEVSDLTTTVYTLTQPLQAGRWYYWRVVAQNACGSAASVVRSFYVPQAGICPPGWVTVTLFQEDFETGGVGWTHGGLNDTWVLTPTTGHGQVYFAKELASVSDPWLASPPISLPVGLRDLQLVFWNRQNLESRSQGGCYDGGLLEVSTDHGATWSIIGDSAMLTDPYDGPIAGSVFGNPLAGQPAWCGDPQDWLASVVDLSAYAGQQVRFRFHLGTDSSLKREGWFVDTVRVQGCVYPVYLPQIQR